MVDAAVDPFRPPPLGLLLMLDSSRFELAADYPEFYHGQDSQQTDAMEANMTEESQSTSKPETLRDRVQSVLELMRPMIQEDDGDIELIDVTPEGLVQIRFMGACIDCPSSANTLHNGIERMLKERVPEVTGVEATEPESKSRKS